VVVGGGVAGLSTAYRLLTADRPPGEVLVLEAEPDPGGKLRSVRVGDLELEAGPDSILARKPAAVGLARELGLGEDLVPSAARTALVWSDGELLPFPSGPFGISTDLRGLWAWPGMSRRGKLRAAADLVLPRPRATTDRSIGSLMRRRLGDEATEALVAPLLGGLFAGDVDRLSVAATFPELDRWERRHGGLIRGARAAARAVGGGPPAPMFLRLRAGLRRLTDGLTEAVGRERVRTGQAVEGVAPKGGGFEVAAAGRRHEADAVVFACPAFVTADLVEPWAPEAGRALRAIRHVSTAVVLLAYPEGTATALPEASGFVVPRGRLTTTACTFVSRKWPEAAFGDRAVLRCFVGADGSEDALDRNDDELVERVAAELASLLPLPDPAAGRVVRWPRSMPQYEVGHLDRVAAIERALPAGIHVVGQAYRGAGISDCVRQATELAGAIASPRAAVRAGAS